MLKALFSSQTRIKLLKTFLSSPEEEYFIRQLTRLLNEQINSIRRELDNLKKIGLLRSRMKNKKKYFYVNTHFIIFHELRNVFVKATANDKNLKKDLEHLGDIDLALLSGKFVNDPNSETDLLIVGDIVTKKLEDYLSQDLDKSNMKFSVFSRADFDYRLEVKDSFVLDIIQNSNNIYLINKLKKSLDKLLEHQ